MTISERGESTPQELAAFALRMVIERIGFRIDVMRERGLDGVSISKGFAEEIKRACQHGSELLENPKPAQAGLTDGSGSVSANVSEGVTAERESAGEAGGEAEGHLKLPEADDPPANPAAIAGPSLLRPAEQLKSARLNSIDWNALRPLPSSINISRTADPKTGISDGTENPSRRP